MKGEGGGGGGGGGRKVSFFFSHPPPRLLAPFFARSLTLAPCSLLRNSSETLATQATKQFRKFFNCLKLEKRARGHCLKA